MAIPTEPIGSIPRPAALLEGMGAFGAGEISQAQLDELYDDAVRDTLTQSEATGSPIVTDGEQRKPSFATYPIAGLDTLAPDGVPITFADGHVRQLFARRVPGRPRPRGGARHPTVPGSRSRQCPGRLHEERKRIGIHTCPGGDQDSTHSADVDYVDLLPLLLTLDAGRFYIQLASESNRPRVLDSIAEHSHDDQQIFVGVIDPIDPVVESAEEVRDRVLEAAGHIPVVRLGTTDDCGFSPFGDDTSTARETAFAKISARVAGTALAAEALGLSA